MIILMEGNKAPAFTSKDQNGNLISLSDFKGKKIVLYFYPEDDTPTCTIEACNFRDNYTLLKQRDIVVLGVSPDGETKHKKFEQKFKLPFTLITDEEKKIINKYGVWGEKNLYGRKYIGLYRTTFLIDEKELLKKYLKSQDQKFIRKKF